MKKDRSLQIVILLTIFALGVTAYVSYLTWPTPSAPLPVMQQRSKPEVEVSSLPLEDQAESSQEALTEINHATLEDLMQVKGIGEKKANAILDFLADRGGILQMQELLEVEGIGEKTLTQLELAFTATAPLGE